MRYDKPIYFQTVELGEYLPNGDYAEDAVTEVQRYASVTDSGAQTMLLVYGGIKQGSKTIRLQNHYEDPFSYIRIDSKRYRVDTQRKLRRGHTFVVSEVQGNGTN